MANVLFRRGTWEKFQALPVKDENTLYWLSDVEELWKGDVLYGKGKVATALASGLMSAADKAKLDALAEGGVSGLSAVDASLVIETGEDGGTTVGVKLSKVEGNAIVLKDDGLYVAPELVLDGGTLQFVETSDVPYEGAVAGDPYIDLVLNAPDKPHITIPMSGLVKPVTAGNGIDVAGSTVAVKLDAVQANGLFVGEGGLALAAASTESAGAMSAEDKAALDSVVASVTWGDM